MRTTILLTAALLAAACGTLNPKPPKPEVVRFKSQNEAGSVLVGVQSVAPFEAYVDALQPRFVLSSDDALRDAISASQIQDLRQLRSLALRIALNLPTRTTTSSTEIESNGEGTTTSETRNDSQASGAAPTVEVPGAITDLIDRIEKEPDAISTDASLRYRSAAALLQEVALLSNYVRDAAVSSDTAPYVVRLLLTVFPSSRRSPYDIYTNISFFFAPDEDQVPFIYNRKALVNKGDDYVDQKIDGCSQQPVPVIPLFVTDNLEASILRSTRGVASDLGGTVGGSVGAVGAGVGGALRQEAGAATLGRGINALFTLGPAAENTLAVRLGAANSDGGFEMLPRTYNLTALVLIPTVRLEDWAKSSDSTGYYQFKNQSGATENDILAPCSSIVYWAHSTFRDALNGSTLPSPGIKSLEKELSDLGIGPEAVQAVLTEDFQKFRESYQKTTVRKAEYDWSAAMAARSRTGLTGGHFKVPRPIFEFFKRRDGEKVALYDDGTTSSVRLAGAAGIVSKGLSGRLTIEGGGKTLTIYQTRAEANEDGTGATIEFPSVRQAAKSMGLTPEKIQVEVFYSPPLRNWSPASQSTHTWIQEDTPMIAIEAPQEPDEAPPSDRVARRGQG
ncbi:MAG TPA: hypothetical protein VJ725_08650 [Thermoanaerobaculia bacterium]|nr:hypothetical protein [Thermoanaerobaculia bacterium]